VIIAGDAVFGETLSAVTSSLTSSPTIPALGTLSYQWKRNGANISDAKSATYKLIQEDISNPISVEVAASNCTGTKTSAATDPVSKAIQAAPTTPTMANNTATSITLNTIIDCEYNINGGVYQNSPIFSELLPNTSYPFTQRMAETPTHLASEPSSTSIFATTPLGIEDNECNKIMVFSYQNTVYIRTVEADNYSSLQSVEIYDMLGQVVYTGAITSTEMTITLQVASGIYTVKLISQNEKAKITKVSIIK
jgi:hypothetical protein